MKYKLFHLFFILILANCSDKPSSDSELLEIDKKNLTEQLKSYKVSSYKFGKIMIRASVAQDNTSLKLMSFKDDIDNVSNKLVSKDNLTLIDYLSIYRDYRKMEKIIENTDEDIFPTIVEAINIIYSDSLSHEKKFLEGKDKIFAQNIEHSILSGIVLLSKDLGKEIALYECSKTNPELLPDSEIKALLQFMRGFIFFEKKLHYLSENEISRNISWLNRNQNIDLPYTRALFQWGNLDFQQTHIVFHAINHLFRAFDRLMMEREIDEDRALDDFEIFLEDCRQIGLNNEVVWSVESFLYLKKGKNEKAIVSMNKLKASAFLSSSEKETIDESVLYLKNRAPENILNGVYDKYFISKIASKYVLSILSKIDWERVLKEQNVPHTNEIFETLQNFKNLIENFEQYPSAEALKEKSSNLWNKAKEFTE